MERVKDNIVFWGGAATEWEERGVWVWPWCYQKDVYRQGRLGGH
jgi:hypothetical protein